MIGFIQNLKEKIHAAIDRRETIENLVGEMGSLDLSDVSITRQYNRLSDRVFRDWDVEASLPSGKVILHHTTWSPMVNDRECMTIGRFINPHGHEMPFSEREAARLQKALPVGEVGQFFWGK